MPVSFVLGDACRMDFKDNTFDVVAIGNSLHHIPDLAALLAEMKRVVKPDGLIILSEMYNDGQPKASLTHWILHDIDCTMHTIDGIYHHPTYSKSEILWLARNAGLTVEKTLCDLIDDPKVVAKLRERIAAVPENLKKYESDPAHAFLAAEAAWLNEEYEANGVTSADSASTLFAWDAIVELTGPDGIRRLPISEFYIRAGKVDIREGEIQTAILIPKESYEDTCGHYIKYAMRNAMDIATLGTSVNVRLSADKKTVLRARVAFGVAGPIPLRAVTAESLAAGQPVSMELAERFAQAVKADIHPRDSWRAAKDFRMHIAVESAKRAFIESVKLCGGAL